MDAKILTTTDGTKELVMQCQSWEMNSDRCKGVGKNKVKIFSSAVTWSGGSHSKPWEGEVFLCDDCLQKLNGLRGYSVGFKPAGETIERQNTSE